MLQFSLMILKNNYKYYLKGNFIQILLINSKNLQIKFSSKFIKKGHVAVN